MKNAVSLLLLFSFGACIVLIPVVLFHLVFLGLIVTCDLLALSVCEGNPGTTKLLLLTLALTVAGLIGLYKKVFKGI